MLFHVSKPGPSTIDSFHGLRFASRPRAERGIGEGRNRLWGPVSELQKKVVKTKKYLDNWLEWPINKNEKR